MINFTDPEALKLLKIDDLEIDDLETYQKIIENLKKNLKMYIINNNVFSPSIIKQW